MQDLVDESNVACKIWKAALRSPLSLCRFEVLLFPQSNSILNAQILRGTRWAHIS